MRIMGLDFGSKTVGVAVSDPLGITAQGVEIVRRKSPNKLRQTLARIDELVHEYGVEELVLGYPKNMNGTEGERCEKTKEFKELLEKRTGLPVALWDERLTTVAADRSMMEAGLGRYERKEYVDEIAAVFILQGYMAARTLKTEEGIG
ncbi:MAG: Holliday junction resolvase RuvX [Lachnospiraceae bacterium]|nr:Holliday junction resolvase RuvX [Lachnospiraceae bacterium]MDD7176384.1 Holliday junction resolvase RuvX [bacterium]MDY5517472.1 Holliday junction resolvase RuvX [Lachnospiraceae bacterium]